MSGFVGLKTPRNQKQGTAGYRECAQNSKRECAGLAVGLVAPTEEKKASINNDS
jgi:hypothetical protein